MHAGGEPPRVISMVALSARLATRRLASRCDRRSAAPDRVTPTSARPGRPKVLDQGQRPGLRDLQCDHVRPPGTGPTCRAAAGPVACGRCPTARRRCGRSVASRPATRVDRPAELARQPDRSGGHPGAWLGAPRHRQSRITADEIGETRCEAAESDPPRGGDMGIDDRATVSPVCCATSARSAPS